METSRNRSEHKQQSSGPEAVSFAQTNIFFVSIKVQYWDLIQDCSSEKKALYDATHTSDC